MAEIYGILFASTFNIICKILDSSRKEWLRIIQEFIPYEEFKYVQI